MLIGVGIIVIALALIMVGLLLKLRGDVAGFKQYWTQQQTVKPEDSKVYIALGDSVAQGLGASQPTKGYVGLLAVALKEKYNQPITVINVSVTGAKIKDVIDNQLPQLRALTIPKDAIVTIDIGANDLKNFNKDVFTGELDELYKQLPKQTVVADIPYFGGGRYKGREPQAKLASEVVHAVALRYGLRVAAVHQTTQQQDSLFVYAADYFHPNNRGYHNWFEAFWQVLKD